MSNLVQAVPALVLWLIPVVVAQPLHPQAAHVIRRATLPRNLDSAVLAGTARIVDSAKSADVPANATSVVLRPGQFLAARVADTSRTIVRPPLGMTGGRPVAVIALPFRYLGTTNDGHPVHLRPAVIRESPLRYQPETGVFRGSLLVALEDSLAPRIPKQLGGPVRLNFASQGHTVSPDVLDLAFTNNPLTRIIVDARQPSDSVRVEIVPEFNLKGIPVWMLVQPVLAFQGAPARVSGLGIQTTSFPVRVSGRTIATPVMVTLATDRGTLVENRVEIGPSGSAKLRLRSAGIGPARLSATSPGMDPVETTIQFSWPITFLAAALLGGAIGGLTAQVNRKGGRKGRTGQALLKGLLVGFVVAVVYYAIDVMLLPFDVAVPFFDEAAVFALAVLGGLFGMRALQPAKT